MKVRPLIGRRIREGTSHLTISMRGYRKTGKIQRNNLPSRGLRAGFNAVFDLHAPNASEFQKSLSEKYPYRVLSTGAGKLPPQTSQLPPKKKFS